MPTRGQDTLFNERSFITHALLATTSINKHYGTNISFDPFQCKKAHQAAKNDNKIILGFEYRKDLADTYDTFLDLLLEQLISCHVFSSQKTFADHDNYSIQNSLTSLISFFDEILPPLLVVDDLYRKRCFQATAFSACAGR